MLLLLGLMMGSTATRPPRRLDERITLRSTDKIPYGTRVAYDLLPLLFPSANVARELAAPGEWDSLSSYEDNQAVILVAEYLNAETDDLQKLADFVERGNHVFIITGAVSDDVESYFNVSYSNYATYYGKDVSDSLHLRLAKPAFSSAADYSFPGIKYEGTIYVRDSSRGVVLGRNERGLSNFVQFNKGRGSFFLHSSPLAFSNYFILHKANAAYYEQAFSVLPKDLKTIVWNEFYLLKPDDNKEPNWLKALFSYPAFKWGFLIAAVTLLLAIILGMRRRQRMIPPHEKPKNDSLDFVKTLGRLYYDRRDHKNLAEKMATYFLEHVRSRYKLPTHTLDEEFVKALHFKSGYPEAETKRIVDAIHNLRLAYDINEFELSAFHKQLKAFYQNT